MQPDNEHIRLAFLHSLNILDTPIEESYERITRLLCRVLDVPIAGVSLVDEKRQWFKSIQGSSIVEVNRSDSFCAHTILNPHSLVVRDARSDERFKRSRLVLEDPHTVFYAGYPIVLAKDIIIGALCIFDTEPRELSAQDAQFLEDMSQTVASEMKARLLHNMYDTTSIQKAAK